MPRKKTILRETELLEKDKIALKLAWDFSFVTKDDLKRVGFGDSRIEMLIKNNIYEIKEDVVNEKIIEILTLTEKGEKWTKHLGHQGKYNSPSTQHDEWQKDWVIKQFEKANAGKEINKSKTNYDYTVFNNYRNEKWIKNEYAERIEECKAAGIDVSTPDGLYWDSQGKIRVVETTTVHYTAEMIQAKRDFVEHVLGLDPKTSIDWNHHR